MKLALITHQGEIVTGRQIPTPSPELGSQQETPFAELCKVAADAALKASTPLLRK
jgi:hypothetical protein